MVDCRARPSIGIVVAVVAALAAGGTSSQAAFPGTNGLIAFNRLTPEGWTIAVANPSESRAASRPAGSKIDPRLISDRDETGSSRALAAILAEIA